MITFLTDTEFKGERISFSLDAEDLAQALARLKRTGVSSVSILGSISLAATEGKKSEVPQESLESLLETDFI